MSAVDVPPPKLPPNEHQTVTEEIVEGQVDTVDTKARYLAYANRFRTIALASSRYLAYTSGPSSFKEISDILDVGEAFRNVTRPWVVRGAYGVSWGYVLTDVGYEAYKAKSLNHETTPVVLSLSIKRALFQSIASMGLPALTIHSLVKYSGKYIFSKSANRTMRVWGPAAVGLGCVPALPYLYDHPVEHAIDRLWEKVDEIVPEKYSTKNARVKGHAPEKKVQ
jgi:mitochondrial fission process protein 1